MTSLEVIKEKIEKLYAENNTIHIDSQPARSAIPLKNASVKIKGVYPHIFVVEECEGGNTLRRHAIQYADVFTKHIVISELNL